MTETYTTSSTVQRLYTEVLVNNFYFVSGDVSTSTAFFEKISVSSLQDFQNFLNNKHKLLQHFSNVSNFIKYLKMAPHNMLLYTYIESLNKFVDITNMIEAYQRSTLRVNNTSFPYFCWYCLTLNSDEIERLFEGMSDETKLSLVNHVCHYRQQNPTF